MAPQEEEDDDFSFPTTTSSPPRFIGSPRLWRSSSCSFYLHQTQATKQEQKEQGDQPTSEDGKRIKLLSYIKNKDGGKDGENMDVIWEDLNYEEEINCGDRRRSDWVSLDSDDDWGRRRMDIVKLRCVPQSSLRLGRGGGKRRSMVVVVNVLKKLFLLQNPSRDSTVKK